jgi:hypothetical protein
LIILAVERDSLSLSLSSSIYALPSFPRASVATYNCKADFDWSLRYGQPHITSAAVDNNYGNMTKGPVAGGRALILETDQGMGVGREGERKRRSETVSRARGQFSDAVNNKKRL